MKKTKHLKKLLLLIALIGYLKASGQQVDFCIVEDYDSEFYEARISSPPPGTGQPGLPVVFNLAFWQLNDKDGNYTTPLTDEYVLNAVAKMNIAYNEYGIFFKYNGLREFNSPDNVIHRQKIDSDGDGDYECTTIGDGVDPDGFMKLSQCQLGALGQYINANDYIVPNSYNIYVPYRTTDYGGSASASTGRMTFNRGGVSGSGMIHEFGHMFGLAHTFGSGNAWRSDNPEACEHVTRDPNNSAFNAYTKGDGYLDTASVPNFSYEYCHENGLPDTDCLYTDLRFYYIDEATCSYTGTTSTDCAGTFYEIFDSDISNFMAYTRNSCRSSFTDEQIERMQARVTSTNLDAFKGTLESLYEPYNGEYYFAGPVDPNIHTPYFQPGFTYFFQRCDGDYPQPSSYYDVNFNVTVENLKVISPDETDYRSIYHPNHSAIYIKEVRAITNNPQRRKCYNNYNRAAIGGKVTRFQDNVINYNTTVTQMGSEINDDGLIDNLENGLYKIEKSYEDGETKETIVQKQN